MLFIKIKKKIFTAFMNHSVYSARAMIAILRESQIKIIIQANHSLYLLPVLFDNSWSIFDKKTLINLDKQVVSKAKSTSKTRQNIRLSR